MFHCIVYCNAQEEYCFAIFKSITFGNNQEYCALLYSGVLLLQYTIVVFSQYSRLYMYCTTQDIYYVLQHSIVPSLTIFKIIV